ncbi:SMP-30/gluconolactonase/LRE family protein [Aureimonas jatrophae]|uniref:Sugar lactone lactonase YvrE n=1 Tax=Aureimonas jatrophae TaxID=1166073 RepID=A0A1H0K259_9HYPH|nr:L-dopachrome tautomerase-related protein [Aureimonas jatrophae]MBB3950911.1 sugar lactone lactonase YvrE [Aureimonas jatrophae]SDO49976.1 Sugar lactone lactonase YvrE [Aureimonas jatrophae]
MIRRRFLALSAAAAAAPLAARAQTNPPAPGAVQGAQASPARPAGEMELAYLADAPSTPTGLAVSAQGRVFLMMPRFTGREPITVGEVLEGGRVVAYPSEALNRVDRDEPQRSMFHVPNGVFGANESLWLLDAGLPEGKGVPVKGGAKLIEVDLGTNEVRRVLPLDPAIEPTSSLNDLRVDAQRNRAFITDQGQDGQGAILAVDLETGRCVRRLAEHPSTKSQEKVVKFVEARPVMQRPTPDAEPKSPQGGANGIALSPDGARLYYAPLMARRLYAVDAALLLDENATDGDVAASVEDLGEKGMTGGLSTDSQDRVYLTLQEQNALARRHPDGRIEVLGSDPRLVWADTISITPDRWLYVSGAQVNRRPEYNGGEDLQKPPYAILRVRIDADPA